MSQSPLARLWSAALAALSRLRGALIPLDTLQASERRTVSGRLREMESFCRRLALAEALALVRAGLPASLRRSAPAEGRNSKRTAPLPRLRLWPVTKRTGPRVRLLGPPTSMREIWRDQKRDALIERLRRARRHRKPAHLRLADRIDALQRFLDRPRAALKRLARKLQTAPKLALRLAANLTALRRSAAYVQITRELNDQLDGVVWPLVRDTS